jgi:hypothetical protein
VPVAGLKDGTLYRWRARVLYAPFTVTEAEITAPPNPAHGPWRRFLGQEMEADLRTMSCTYGLTVAPASDDGRGSPGGTVTYRLRLTNDGDCEDTADVAVSGEKWNTTAPGTVGPLEAGRAVYLEVTVEIPTDASGGDSDSATITFTSQGDPDQSASSILTTTVGGWKVYLPVVVRDQ